MKQLKSLFAMTKTQAAVVAGVVGVTAAQGSFAAAGDLDLSTMVTGIAVGTVVTSIVAMGVVKIAPNFAKWAVNKVASFF